MLFSTATPVDVLLLFLLSFSTCRGNDSANNLPTGHTENDITENVLRINSTDPSENMDKEAIKQSMKRSCKMCMMKLKGPEVKGSLGDSNGTETAPHKAPMGCCSMCQENMENTTANSTGSDSEVNKFKRACCPMCMKMADEKLETANNTNCCKMCGRQMEVTEDNESGKENGTMTGTCKMCHMHMGANMQINVTDTNSTDVKEKQNTKTGCPMCKMHMSKHGSTSSTSKHKSSKGMCRMCMSHMKKMHSMGTTTTASQGENNGVPFIRVWKDSVTLQGALLPALLGVAGVLTLLIVACLLRRRRGKHRRHLASGGAYSPIHKHEVKAMASDDSV